MNLKRLAGAKLVSAKKRPPGKVRRGNHQARNFLAQIMTSRTNSRTNGNTSVSNGKGFVCSGCNKAIKRDKFLLKACDKYWHENCLRCDRCHSRLGELGSTLYCKSNMNLCRQDYLEMFGETGVCSVCEKLISASEMVMRARENVYHLECFACQLCSQRFCVGDRFYLCENKVVCQFDYEEHILPIQRSLIEQQQEQPGQQLHQFGLNLPGTHVQSSPEVSLDRADGAIEAAPAAVGQDDEQAKKLTPLESVQGPKKATSVSAEQPRGSSGDEIASPEDSHGLGD